MKKLTKLLSVLLMAGVMVGTGGAIAGCKSDNDDKKPAHTHAYKYVSDGESGHHQECKDGDDTKATVAHNYGDDNVCDDCGYTKTPVVEHTHDYEYVSDGESGHHQECKD